MQPLKTHRDVLVLGDERGDVLVTAVDSCGAIGEKPGDVVRTSLEVAVTHTVRVALLEVVCTGARPAFCTLNVCNDPEAGGRALVATRAVIGHVPVVMSTEKNMPTCMSAFGISVTGICKRADLRLGRAQAGDRLFCAGLPLVGDEVVRAQDLCFSAAHLNALYANPCVRAVIPCGSHGIAKEAGVLAAESGLTLELQEKTELDLCKSAGPATCAVFAADLSAAHDFQLGIPVTCIGRLA